MSITLKADQSDFLPPVQLVSNKQSVWGATLDCTSPAFGELQRSLLFFYCETANYANFLAAAKLVTSCFCRNLKPIGSFRPMAKRLGVGDSLFRRMSEILRPPARCIALLILHKFPASSDATQWIKQDYS